MSSQMTKFLIPAVVVLLLIYLGITIYIAYEYLAADNDPGEPAALPEPEFYPTEIVMQEENGALLLKKKYILHSGQDPAGIPTADIMYDGQTYRLQDILQEDQTVLNTKTHTEIVTKEVANKDLSQILPQFEPSMEISTADGYTGILTLDHTSINVEAAGYKSISRDITTTRTYPDLADADLALLPKTVKENGRTLTLTDVEWQSAAADVMDGYELPLYYTAVVTYTGTAISNPATGYLASGTYTGELTRAANDTIIYTAVFAPQKNMLALWLPCGLLILTALAIGGWRIGQYYINKKRGYA